MSAFLKKARFEQIPILAVMVWLLVAGCAAPKTGGLALDPVGPAPGGHESGSNGMLVVYSTYNFQTNVDRFFGRTHPACADYKIFRRSGRLVQSVRNDAGEMEGPVMVKLPAGDYQVKAYATGYGVVALPVVIKAGQTTAVRLDESAWPERAAMIQAGAVRLPDGRVVGWRAGPQVKTN